MKVVILYQKQNENPDELFLLHLLNLFLLPQKVKLDDET